MLGRLGAVATSVVLGACGHAPAPEVAAGPAVRATTTTTATAVTTGPAVGEPFALGDVQITVLTVRDPFPPTAQTQPQPGNRLLSLRYETVSLATAAIRPADLPAAEVRDATGARYRSDHGRIDMVGGAGVPGELPAGMHVQISALFEIPDGATGLQAVFNEPGHPDREAVAVLLG